MMIRSACWRTVVMGWLGLVASQLSAQVGAPRIYFFSMDGCPPCAAMEPAIERLIAQGVPITKIDAKRQPDWCQRFQVNSTPTTVFVVGNREVGRQGGVFDTSGIPEWVAKAQAANSETTNLNHKTSKGVGTSPAGPPAPFQGGERQDPLDPTTGTRRPGNQQERVAMQATVRIKVEDESGFSYGTGTIIHSNDSEALVLTCGHLFRDWKNSNRITVDVGWLTDSPTNVVGELLSFDSDANDVGLIAIHTTESVASAPLAHRENVAVGNSVFSIGCDLGKPPTIRPSKIKNLATYDGSQKYDIFGRPVVGRSGGGLFNSAGELIGVCNAAAVNEDEGVFSSIHNIQAQLARANLTHLFWDSSNDVRIASVQSAPSEQQHAAAPIPPSAELLALAEDIKIANRNLEPVPPFSQSYERSETPPVRLASNETPWENRVSTNGGGTELVVLIRSKTDPSRTETIVLNDPDQELLDQLRQYRLANPTGDFANRRESMPQVREPEKQFGREIRGQSPDRN